MAGVNNMRIPAASAQNTGLCSGRRFFQRDQFVHERVGSFFQEHAPRTKDCQGGDTNQQKHPDRHFANAESEPDDIRLMNEIQAIGIEAHKTEKFGWPLE